MIYDIRLVLDFDYASPASDSRQRACLPPLDIPGNQSVDHAELVIQPRPDERREERDFFGNRVTGFTHRNALRHIALTMTARVARVAERRPLSSTPLGLLAAELGASNDLGPASPLHFLTSSFRVPLSAAMTRFARAQILPDQTAAEAVFAIGSALHRHMRFDALATTVDTTAVEAFARRSGVCQDFSHILIACLRGVGIPAGYVSGFLRTLPPPGAPRLEGADAMHAWIRAWAGQSAGWIEFDPTNDCRAGGNHITVAHGRDYCDVAPIKGSFRIAGGQTSRQAVDVVPVSVPG